MPVDNQFSGRAIVFLHGDAAGNIDFCARKRNAKAALDTIGYVYHAGFSGVQRRISAGINIGIDCDVSAVRFNGRTISVEFAGTVLIAQGNVSASGGFNRHIVGIHIVQPFTEGIQRDISARPQGAFAVINSDSAACGDMQISADIHGRFLAGIDTGCVRYKASGVIACRRNEGQAGIVIGTFIAYTHFRLCGQRTFDCAFEDNVALEDYLDNLVAFRGNQHGDRRVVVCLDIGAVLQR